MVFGQVNRYTKSRQSWGSRSSRAASGLLASLSIVSLFAPGCSSDDHLPVGNNAGNASTTSGAGTINATATGGGATTSGSTGGSTTATGTGYATGAGGRNGSGTASGAGGAMFEAGATAGTSGGSAAAGAGGGASDGGGAIDGGRVVPSAGCGLPPPAGQTPATYVKYTETVAGVPTAWAARNYYVWLPTGYDSSRAYPTVFVGPGCGGNGTQGIAIFKASGNDAIVVGLDPDPAAEGRPCFNTEVFPDPEVPYFDETLKEVESKFCVDKSRLFIEGFSSGSWMANLIGCTDGHVLRGQGNASGCVQNLPAGACKGPIAYIGAHNDPDPNNSYACGTANRDRIIKLNGCTNETTPYDPGPDVKAPPGSTLNCVQYKGCMPGYPVVFCTTTGLGHSSQEASGLSTFGFWRFWMSLPPAATTQ